MHTTLKFYIHIKKNSCTHLLFCSLEVPFGSVSYESGNVEPESFNIISTSWNHIKLPVWLERTQKPHVHIVYRKLRNLPKSHLSSNAELSRTSSQSTASIYSHTRDSKYHNVMVNSDFLTCGLDMKLFSTPRNWTCLTSTRGEAWMLYNDVLLWKYFCVPRCAQQKHLKF